MRLLLPALLLLQLSRGAGGAPAARSVAALRRALETPLPGIPCTRLLHRDGEVGCGSACPPHCNATRRRDDAAPAPRLRAQTKEHPR